MKQHRIAWWMAISLAALSAFLGRDRVIALAFAAYVMAAAAYFRIGDE